MKVNGELEQKFTDPGKNLVISQECMECHEACNSGTHEAIEYMTGTGRLGDLIAAEIMTGTNEKAVDILRTCGGDIFIPGTTYTSLHEMAEFYGTTLQYIKGVLYRNKIVPSDTSLDAIRSHYPSIIERLGVGERYAVSNTYNGWIFCDKKTHKQFVFKNTTNGNLYSARAALALAVLMQYSRMIYKDSKGAKVYDILMKSTYADAARDKYEELKQARQKRRQEQFERDKKARLEQSANPPTGAVLNKDGTVVLTTEFFATVINTAIREGISEFAKMMQAPGSALANTSTHAVKPENWDRISKYYAAGILTLPEAAALTKMSEEDFTSFLQDNKSI